MYSTMKTSCSQVKQNLRTVFKE